MPVKKTIIEPSWEAKYSFSPAVITEGGKTIWLAGHVGFVDDAGVSLAGNFDAQVRQASGKNPSACWGYAERYRLDDSCHFRWTPLAAVHRYSQGNIRKRFPSEHIADSSLFCRARNHGGDHPDSGCRWITAQKPIMRPPGRAGLRQHLDKLISAD